MRGFLGGAVVGLAASVVTLGGLSLVVPLPGQEPPQAVSLDVPPGSEFNTRRADEAAVVPSPADAPDLPAAPRVAAPAPEIGVPSIDTGPAAQPAPQVPRTVMLDPPTVDSTAAPKAPAAASDPATLPAGPHADLAVPAGTDAALGAQDSPEGLGPLAASDAPGVPDELSGPAAPATPDPGEDIAALQPAPGRDPAPGAPGPDALRQPDASPSDAGVDPATPVSPDVSGAPLRQPGQPVTDDIAAPAAPAVEEAPLPAPTPVEPAISTEAAAPPSPGGSAPLPRVTAAAPQTSIDAPRMALEPDAEVPGADGELGRAPAAPRAPAMVDPAAPAAPDADGPAARPLPIVRTPRPAVQSDGPRIGTPGVSLVGRDDPARIRLGSADAASGSPAAEAAGSDADLPALTRNAVRFDNPGDKPLMSIVLVDQPGAGLGPEALAAFPFPVTVAVDPMRPGAAAAMQRYRDAGLEVAAIARLPQGAAARDVEVALSATLSAAPLAAALIEAPEGLTLQSSREATGQIAAILAATGHGVVFQNNGLNTAQKLALKEGVAAGRVFRDFDSDGQSGVVMRRFLDQAAFRAGQEPGVIMLGRMRPDTISAVLLWGLQDRASRVTLAPLSAVLTGLTPGG